MAEKRTYTSLQSDEDCDDLVLHEGSGESDSDTSAIHPIESRSRYFERRRDLEEQDENADRSVKGEANMADLTVTLDQDQH